MTLTFGIDWQESCKRRRDIAAENLIHFIYDGIRGPNLPKEKGLELLQELLLAQEKVDNSDSNLDLSNYTAILICQEKLKTERGLTVFEMIKDRAK